MSTRTNTHTPENVHILENCDLSFISYTVFELANELSTVILKWSIMTERTINRNLNQKSDTWAIPPCPPPTLDTDILAILLSHCPPTTKPSPTNLSPLLSDSLLIHRASHFLEPTWGNTWLVLSKLLLFSLPPPSLSLQTTLRPATYLPEHLPTNFRALGTGL